MCVCAHARARARMRVYVPRSVGNHFSVPAQSCNLHLSASTLRHWERNAQVLRHLRPKSLPGRLKNSSVHSLGVQLCVKIGKRL